MEQRKGLAGAVVVSCLFVARQAFVPSAVTGTRDSPVPHRLRGHDAGSSQEGLSATSMPGIAVVTMAAAVFGMGKVATTMARQSAKARITPITARSAIVEPAAGPPLSKPSLDLSGKHYIVTGGTQGLGLEIARQLQICGASKLVLMSRTRAKGEACAKELSCDGCEVFFVEADMSDPSSLQTGADEAIKVMGGHVDGLVCAAGTTERGNLFETTVEMFDKQFDINTRGPFFLTQSVAKHMIDTGTRGAIVHISSIGAKGGAPFITAYSGSKGALNIIAQNNAAELAPHGIRVMCINMGWTLTENENKLMTAKGGENWLADAEPNLPMKRVMRPVDPACTVCFLLSPAAEMMTGHVVDLHPDTFVGLLSMQTTDSIER